MHFWKNSRQYAWLFGVLLGVFFIVMGAVQGQFAVIWKKAVMICLECIGLA